MFEHGGIIFCSTSVLLKYEPSSKRFVKGAILVDSAFWNETLLKFVFIFGTLYSLWDYYSLCLCKS